MKNFHSGLTFKPDHKLFHPLISGLVLIQQFILSVVLSGEYLFVFWILLFCEVIILRHVKSVLLMYRAILPLLTFIGILTLFFGGPIRAITILLRFLIGAVIFSLFFSTTNPYELSKALEKLKIPQRYAYIPALSLGLLPRTIKDAGDTFDTLLLRGEISDSFFKWIPKTLSVLIASAIYRSKFVSQSLYLRNFGMETRTVNLKHKLAISDLTKLIYYILITVFLFTNVSN